MPRRNLSVYPLTAEKVDQAYPLAREGDRGMALDDWRRHAARRLAAMPGDANARNTILVVERNGWLRALAECDAGDASARDRVLRVTGVVVADRFRDPQLALALLGGILRLAETSDCARVCVALDAASGWLQRHWSDPDGTVFRRPVACTRKKSAPDREPTDEPADVLAFPPPYPNAPANSNT